MQDPTNTNNVKPQDEKPAFMTVEQTPQLTEQANPQPAVTAPESKIQNLENLIPNNEPFIVTPASSNSQGPSRIATMLGIFVFAIGAVAGLLLIRSRQNLGSNAYDCQHYTFNVSQAGLVTISTQNNSGISSSQKANVLIDSQLVKTFDISNIDANQSVNLGTVTVPGNGQFSWQVVGTSACSSSGSYTSQNSCQQCQYQLDTFWGPVLQSLAGGVRYDTRRIDSRSSRNVDTNLPVCGTLAPTTPTSVTVPNLPAGCTNPVSNGYLTATFNKNNSLNYWDVTITNTTQNCTYAVGAASYKTNDAIFDSNQSQFFATQTLFDSQASNLGPSQSTSYKVKVPTISNNSSCYTTSTPTPTPTSTPNTTAQCVGVKVFDTTWNQIPNANLSSLHAGDIVRFTVSGTTSSGGFDKARFVINGITQPEITTLRPGTSDFYYEYTIPSGVTNFSIAAQLHHSVQNQWY